MEKFFTEEANVKHVRPAFIVLSAHQSSHNLCKSTKKKDQQLVYPMSHSGCLHKTPSSSPRVSRGPCCYAQSCKRVAVCNTWAPK